MDTTCRTGGRIIYGESYLWGTPILKADIQNALVASEHEVIAVVTQPG